MQSFRKEPMTTITENHSESQGTPSQTLADFLENTPPNQTVHISDLAVWQNIGPYPNLQPIITKTPLQLHCPPDSCNGVRTFRYVVASDESQRLYNDEHSYFYVVYRCSNCQKTTKVFFLAARVYQHQRPHGGCYKFGEYPPYGPPIPSNLIELIGSESDTFMKGYNCEVQGFGIGAFAYYRRVVENQKNRILREIISVSEKIEVPGEKIDTLREAIRETRFSNALKMVKDVIPESLYVEEHNPMRLLYRALSKGVHELSDEECLQLASSIRVVLAELSERLSSLLKDKAELSKAISTLTDNKEKGR